MSTSTLVILIVGINLFILLIGGGLIWLFTTEKKPNFNIMKKFEKLEVEKGTDPVVADKKLSFIAKILKRKSKKNNI
jgi:flagellar basal body-associated protein FliL